MGAVDDFLREIHLGKYADSLKTQCRTLTELSRLRKHVRDFLAALNEREGVGGVDRIEIARDFQWGVVWFSNFGTLVLRRCTVVLSSLCPLLPPFPPTFPRTCCLQLTTAFMHV
jgi:hypothetical protein